MDSKFSSLCACWNSFTFIQTFCNFYEVCLAKKVKKLTVLWPSQVVFSASFKMQMPVHTTILIYLLYSVSTV